MKKQNMILVLTIVLTSLFNMDIYAQQNSGSHEHRAKMKCCSSTNRIAMSDSTKMMRNKNQKMMKHDSTEMMQHQGHKMADQKDSLDSIVREGVIDLVAIDKNKDGKVFQDPMDWNVISDEPGKCPLCNMKLAEVTIAEAKENLINNGFKIK
ncbi:MAG: hypothetical protein A2068_03895 [Ignavibacteria bacterium GWB2_35_6b]|nr:MAG: hypothetical protein A2068_03895 [Ignavibacteria bacterium GWB2_35_6b]